MGACTDPTSRSRNNLTLWTFLSNLAKDVKMLSSSARKDVVQPNHPFIRRLHDDLDDVCHNQSLPSEYWTSKGKL